MLKLLISLALVGIVLAGESHHADVIRKLVKDHPNTYSNDIIEDALLDVPDLISKYGYPVEVHNVLTSDGYILQVHRIPRGKDNNNQVGPRPVVFVNHGMFGSSADWVVAGPGRAFAYVLAEAGYDVWLGNARGTYYSRRHITMNPDDDIDFWGFSWDEIGRNDLASSIDYVLGVTGQPRLHFAAHSQGGTTYLVLTTLRPEYNTKIASVQAMAPAVFNTELDREALALIAPYLGIVERLVAQAGIAEMFPNSQFVTDVGMTLCVEGAILQPLCEIAFNLFGGASEQLNATLLPVILGHTPAGASFRQIAHFGQLISSGEFRRYDYGALNNLVNYGSLTPPEYQLPLSTAPFYVYYGVNDVSVAYNDLVTLVEALPNAIGPIRVEHPTFNHIDFLYGNNAKELIYDVIIARMRSLDSGPRSEQ